MKNLTSKNNPVCFHLRKLGKSKSYRDQCGEFICDGVKLLREALSSNADIGVVLTSEPLDFKLPAKTDVFAVTADIVDSVSPLSNSQSLVFSCLFKETKICDFTKGTHILLDSVQDPGNVGTIIRCANAFGIDGVILAGASADVYNPKAIRATMGALFRQNFYYMNKDKVMELKESGVKFIGTSNKDNAIDIRKTDLSNAIIILGNEGKGISDTLFGCCDEIIKIPMSPGCESINVASAASIVMWESANRRELCLH